MSAVPCVGAGGCKVTDMIMGETKSFWFSDSLCIVHKSEPIEYGVKGGGFWISGKGGGSLIASRKLNIRNADSIRIIWRIGRHPSTASWESGTKREAIGVGVSFGDQIKGTCPDEGSFLSRAISKLIAGLTMLLIPPPTITFFASAAGADRKLYTGNISRNRLKYVAVNVEPSDDFVEVTLPLSSWYKKAFGLERKLPINALTLECDLRGLPEGDSAYACVRQVDFITSKN